MKWQILVVDALGAGSGRRKFTRDFIGAGPRTVAGSLEFSDRSKVTARIMRVEYILRNSLPLGEYAALFISAMSMDEPAVILAQKIWKKSRPATPFVVGGPITLDPTLDRRVKYDCAVFGEAEEILISIGEQFQEFLDGNYSGFEKFSNFYLPGISHEVPPPDYKVLPKDKWNKIPSFSNHIKQYSDYRSARVIVECVRGCSNFHRPTISFPGSAPCPPSCQACLVAPGPDCCPRGAQPGCGYCATITLFGPPKSRALSLLLEEVQGLCALGVRKIVLGASDLLEYGRESLVEGEFVTQPTSPPLPNYSALDSLVEGLLRINTEFDGNVQFFVENLKITLATPEALAILARLPDPVFSIGVETGDPDHARALGRPGNPLDSLAVVKEAKRLGFRVHAYFIHSLPGLTPKFTRNTLKLMDALDRAGVDKITIYKFRPLPGTYFGDWEKLPAKFRKRVTRLGKQIRDAAIRINRAKKETFVGQVICVQVAEKHFRDSTRAIGRPISGGPLVEIVDGSQYMKKTIQVRIEGVLSDKLLLGVPLKGEK